MGENKTFFKTVVAVVIILVLGSFIISCEQSRASVETGSVIFIHPDGSGASMWGALRLLEYGPDGFSNWDSLERMGLYRSHMTNSSNASSHGGATVHSYGVKVEFDRFGNNPDKPIKSLSGKDYSIMIEARKAGLATALINSGHICEPGTAVFAASARKRNMTDEISLQVIESGVDIILSGGEELLLPKGVPGRHGFPGKRHDGINLIEKARELGYEIVYTRDELYGLSDDVNKVLGVFSASHTFNDKSEEKLDSLGLPLYNAQAPTVAEMTEVALRILDKKGKRFLMVVEEEGTDNFGNDNNAKGTLEALRHADLAIGIALEYFRKNPKTLIITAADSEAGGLQVVAVRDSADFEKPLPPLSDNGAPLDGCDGTGTLPLIAAPDKNGVSFRFGIAWACYDDVAGAVIARAHGLNSDLLGNNVDNTAIYRIMYATLFGELLPEYNKR